MQTSCNSQSVTFCFIILICFTQASFSFNVDDVIKNWKYLGWKQLTLYYPGHMNDPGIRHSLESWMRKTSQNGIQISFEEQSDCSLSHGNLAIIGNDHEAIQNLKRMLLCKRFPESIMLLMDNQLMIDKMKTEIGNLGKTKSFYLWQGRDQVYHLLAIHGQTTLVENKLSCVLNPCKLPHENLDLAGAKITGKYIKFEIYFFPFSSLCSITPRFIKLIKCARFIRGCV